MSSDHIKNDVIKYWLEKANEALLAAHDDFNANRYSFAINRAYYACFYSLSSVLLSEDQKLMFYQRFEVKQSVKVRIVSHQGSKKTAACVKLLFFYAPARSN